MARQLRREYPNALYHLTSRGNARGTLFHDELDRMLFLRTLARVTVACGWICHAYCLMPNHYHLLVETPRPNLSIGMRRLNSTYAQGFNRRYSRVGHVFQGRYHAVVIEKEAHLLEVSRYVVLNPVRAGLCPLPSEWPASSYRATVGEVSCPEFLSVSWLLGQFGDTPAAACERYRAFVADGIDVEPWGELRGGLYLGSEAFASELSRPNEPVEEVPRSQWRPLRRGLNDVFREYGEGGILVAYRDEGYSLREISTHLGVHTSTVSRRLRLLEA